MIIPRGPQPEMNWDKAASIMMTSSNGNIFRVTGPLCGEFTGPGEFPTQRPVTRSFDVLFDLRLNKRLSKQPWGWWFETPARSLWRQRNVLNGSSLWLNKLGLVPFHGKLLCRGRLSAYKLYQCTTLWKLCIVTQPHLDSIPDRILIGWYFCRLQHFNAMFIYFISSLFFIALGQKKTKSGAKFNRELLSLMTHQKCSSCRRIIPRWMLHLNNKIWNVVHVLLITFCRSSTAT